METIIQEAIIKNVREVRSHGPLVPSITNTVTINLVANTQIAAGGSAAMVYMPDEGEAMAQAGEAMYLNLGTIFPIYKETFPRTIRALNEKTKPWVLDPVGIGMGQLRMEILRDMENIKPPIIKGNATEIIALANFWGLKTPDLNFETKGVDSIHTMEEARASALSLARYTGGVVVVSGEEDLVTNGYQVVTSFGGSEYMTHITGAGCALGGIIAVYASQADPFTAALTGVNAFNYAGLVAEKIAGGPGTYESDFIDAIFHATPEDIAQVKMKVEEIDDEEE